MELATDAGGLLFLDTEFNGFGGALISLALVPHDDGDEFYHVLPLPENVDPWVAEHVVPKLGRRSSDSRLFRSMFHGFISQFKNPTIICDWHADAEHFCRLLQGDDYGTSLDYAFTMKVLKTPPGQPVSADPHNALEDARALKRWYLSQ